MKKSKHQNLREKFILSRDGEWVFVGVSHYHSINELKDNTNSLLSKNYIVQEAIESNTNIISSCMFCRNGEVLSYYSHKRIITFPDGDGVSVISKSFSDSKILGISKDLIKQTNYSGFIMIEFLFDVNKNKYYVIEINPRPWGSILLSEFCNSNMIYSYLNYDNMISKVNICYIKWILPHLIFRAFKGKFDLFKYNDAPCCFINISYSCIWGAIFFNLLYCLNISKIIKKLWP